MKKDEKIIIACFLIMFFSLIASYIYTCYQLKPSGMIFRIEKTLKQVQNNKI